MSGRESDERFLAEAVTRGLLTAGQADDCRRLLAALAEVDVALSLDEVLARRGHLDRERAAELRRALARLRVGRYEVIERLGEGGSGVVWKARDVVLDRLVALKLLSPDARGDPAWRERFLREARTAVTLNHASIVRGLDCGEADGYVYFAMEYVPGEAVSARLRREGRLPEADALRIAAEVVRALRYVAALGIVHRDLKPDNVLVTPDGRVKVCDLGLAKPTLEEPDRGRTDAVVAGTPLYVAPEQIRDGDRVDWRADVYALGATLFHMLAGRPPFLYERGRDLLRRHLEEAPPSPREFALDVTPSAAAVVLKMLQKDPGDRYARLEDLEEDLESVLAGRPPRHTISFAAKERPQLDPAGARAVGAADAALRPQRWPVVAATLFALAVVGAAAALIGRNLHRELPYDAPRGSPAARPETARTDPSHAPASTGAARTEPRDAPAATDESAAFAALEAARRHAAAPSEELRARIDAFAFVVERYPGTSAADVAAGVVAALEAESERRGDTALAAARAASAAAGAEGRLGDAARLYDAVVQAHPATRAADEAAAEARRLRESASQKLRALLDATGEALAVGDFDEALRRIDDAAGLGIAWTESEIATRRREIDDARAAAARRRTESRGAFDHAWATAVLASHAQGLAPALSILDAARDEIRPWAREIDELRIDLCTTSATPVDPERAASAVDLRVAYFQRLARRDLAGAAALLPRLAAAGFSTGPLRDGVARVRAELAAGADSLLVLAERARADRRLDDAARHVAAAREILPDHWRVRVASAALTADQGHVDEAIAELTDVLALEPPHPEARLRLAQVLAARRPGDLDRARREAARFLETAPADDPLRPQAEAVAKAIAARVLARSVADARAALALARRGQDAVASVEAAEQLLALSSSGPVEAAALVEAADAFGDAGRPHEAFVLYRRATVASPSSQDARRGLARLERRYAAASEARDAEAEARRLLVANDVEGARAAYDALLRRAPFLDDALCGAAEAWLARKGTGAYALSDDPQRALRLIDVLVLRSPQHARSTEVRAAALLRTGAPRAALEHALRAMAADPARSEPATTAGLAALALDDPGAALEHFTASLTRARTAGALHGRALAWEKLGNLANARADVQVLAEEFTIPDELLDDVRALCRRLDLELVDRSE